MRRPLIIVMLAGLVAAPASATITVAAACDGASIRVDLELSDDASTPGPDWASVVVYRRAMGSTEDPAPMEGGEFAWPLEDGQYTTLQLVDADVEPNWGYHYVARAVDFDGEEHVVSPPGSIAAWASCGGDYPLARGVLGMEFAYDHGGVVYVNAILGPVCEGWWLAPGLCPAMPMEEFVATWSAYLGRTMEIRGHWDYHGMPTECPWATTEMVEIADCAGQVTTLPRSWTAIRRLYD
jgi:hypothetical protein